MKTNRLMWAAVAIVLAVGPAFAQSPEPTSELPDHISPAIGMLEPSQSAPQNMELHFDIEFSIQNKPAADKFLADQANPSSPDYRRSLSGQEFVQRYGPTESQFGAVVDWLTQQGFQVTEGSQLDRFVKFTGTVQQAENAFGVNIAVSSDGAHFGNTNNPHIPTRFVGLFGYIMGLDNLGAAQALHVKPQPATPSRKGRRGSTLGRPLR